MSKVCWHIIKYLHLLNLYHQFKGKFNNNMLPRVLIVTDLEMLPPL